MKFLDSYNNYINEGLTRSLDSDSVRKNLVRKVGINPDSIILMEAEKGVNKITVWFTSKNADKLRSVHDKMTKVFGWFLSGVQTDDLGEPYWEHDWVKEIDIDETARLLKWHVEEYETENEIGMIYERKFEEEYKLNPKTLYHVTQRDSIERIKKQGLVPRSQNKKSLHPDRIYLVTNTDEFEQTDLLDYLYRPVFLEIDNTNLNLKLYHDVNMKGAVYTTDNIPPQSIKVID